MHYVLCPHLAQWEREGTGKIKEMGLPAKSSPVHFAGMWTLSPQSSQRIQKRNGEQDWTLTHELGHHSDPLSQKWNQTSAQQSKLLSSWGGWAWFRCHFSSVFSSYIDFDMWSCHLLTIKFQNKFLLGMPSFMLSNFLNSNSSFLEDPNLRA